MLAILDNLQQRAHITVPYFYKRCASGSWHPASSSFNGHGIGAAISKRGWHTGNYNKVAKTIGELSLPAVYIKVVIHMDKHEETEKMKLQSPF